MWKGIGIGTDTGIGGGCIVGVINDPAPSGHIILVGPLDESEGTGDP